MQIFTKWKSALHTVVLCAVAMTIAGCATSQSSALSQAETNAANRNYYVPVNDVEGRNYDWRQRVSDDPSLILWCTMFPPTPGVKPFTVPIIGKLTSGSKRPFPQATGETENPDATGMYGTSSDYRFGFGPGGMSEYYDTYQLGTFCTTQLMTWQTALTVVVESKDATLAAASKLAHDALAKGDTAGATQILNQAIAQIGGK